MTTYVLLEFSKDNCGIPSSPLAFATWPSLHCASTVLGDTFLLPFTEACGRKKNRPAFSNNVALVGASMEPSSDSSAAFFGGGAPDGSPLGGFFCPWAATGTEGCVSGGGVGGGTCFGMGVG